MTIDTPPQRRVLVVEDDPAIRELVSLHLKLEGFGVLPSADGAEALRLARAESFDLIVLDVMLPGLDGVSILGAIRRDSVNRDTPILMLTARREESDKVLGLETGADDYLTKPFGTSELLARIDALRRRASIVPSDAECVEIDGCLLDLGRCEARRNGTAVPLTPREVGILRWLHRHRTRAVSRAELLQTVWGASDEIETRTVDMTVANLRQKIEREPAEPRIVVTVKGAGYAWGPS